MGPSLQLSAGVRPTMTVLELEPADTNDHGPCACCGSKSRTVSGFAYDGDQAVAAYSVQWTLGEVSRHGAHFDLILGAWDESSTSADRSAVSLEYRHTETGPGFMIIDATDRPLANTDLVGRSYRRDEVIGSSLAKRVFEIVDLIWLQDGRISEISDGSSRYRVNE